MKKIRCIGLLCVMIGVVMCAGFALPCRAASSSGDAPRVLMLSSYSYDWESVPKQLNGVNDVLGGHAKMDTIFMDTKRKDYNVVKQSIYDDIAAREAAEGPYDYVLTGDDDALNFVMEYRDQLFKDVPVVFEGVNTEARAYEVSQDSKCTGVVEAFPIEETIKIARELKPGVTKVVGVTDDSVSGKGSTAQFYDSQKKFSDLTYETVNCSVLTKDQIGEKVAAYGDDTIILFLMMSTDAQHHTYSALEGAGFISEKARVPVYKADEIGIGSGVLGGQVISYYDMAAQAAKIILECINGANISSFSIQTTQTYPLFDKEVMSQFAIRQSQLPANTQYVNNHPAFFEEHRQVLIPATLILLVCLVFILIMGGSNRKYKELLGEIHEKDLMLSNILANIPGGVAVYSINTKNGTMPYLKTKYFSDGVARMCGMTREEYSKAGSMVIGGLVVAEDVTGLIREIKEKAARKERINYRFRLKKGTGIMWIASSSVYIREEEGLPVYYTVFTDASLQIRAEQQEVAVRKAEAENQAKTQFLSTISHDMRTPLNGILGLTTLLQNKTSDPGMREDLDQLETSGRYLLQLINDTLDMSKIESGKMVLAPGVVEGRKLVDNVLALIAPIADKKGVVLDTKIGSFPEVCLSIDQNRVDQILMNLLSNAVKFTPAGGKVTFECSVLAEMVDELNVQMIVRDTGSGISPDYLPTIFEPFSQEENNRLTVNRGSGLGLSITKRMVEMMAGSITIDSTPGEGTIVTVMLPMAKATDGQIKAWKSAKKDESWAQVLPGKRVLLCEDQPLNANITMRLLKSQGVQTDLAENGKKGLETFLQSEPGTYDAILMDVRMPVMDGLTAAKAIRASTHSQTKTIPVIAMTADAFNGDTAGTLAAGMNAHLSKPVEPAVMYALLAEQMQKSQEGQKKGK